MHKKQCSESEIRKRPVLGHGMEYQPLLVFIKGFKSYLSSFRFDANFSFSIQYKADLRQNTIFFFSFLSGIAEWAK